MEIETSMLSWVVVGLGFFLLVGLVVGQQMGKRPRRDKGLRQTRMVTMVRRRRELSVQLTELAGEQSRQLLQTQARRMNGAMTDIAVLEAAVARAERRSDNAELGAST